MKFIEEKEIIKRLRECVQKRSDQDMKKATLLVNRQRFENWQTPVLSGRRRLNDGSYIVALITTVRIEDDALWHRVYIYHGRYFSCADRRQNKLGDRKTLKVETFNNLWDAIHYCETVDLSEFGITIK